LLRRRVRAADHRVPDGLRTEVRHLFATSSPVNPHGVRTLLETGFQPVALLRKFGTRLRFLLYRPSPDSRPAPPAGQPERTVACSATKELEDAFRDDWTGTGIILDDPAQPRLQMQRLPFPFGAVRR
jgi:hypothetical protein